jgi:ABC-2 type transport system permease protein
MFSNINLYRRLIGVQIRSQMQYRISFLVEFVSVGFITALEYGSLALVFYQFESLKGWTLGQVAFIYGLAELAFGIMDMVFSGFDPGTFGMKVRRGSFDQILLRPVNITLQIFGSQFVLRRIGKIIVGIGIFTYALQLVEISWNPIKIYLVATMIFSQILFFGGLFIIGATITFWTVESIEVINIFTYGGIYMISHPMHIYPNYLRKFFTFIVPAIFLNYYPALKIFELPDPFNMPGWAPFLAPIAGMGVLVAALLFWQVGLKQYQSTGT